LHVREWLGFPEGWGSRRMIHFSTGEGWRKSEIMEEKFGKDVHMYEENGSG